MANVNTMFAICLLFMITAADTTVESHATNTELRNIVDHLQKQESSTVEMNKQLSELTRSIQAFTPRLDEALRNQESQQSTSLREHGNKLENFQKEQTELLNKVILESRSGLEKIEKKNNLQDIVTKLTQQERELLVLKESNLELKELQRRVAQQIDQILQANLEWHRQYDQQMAETRSSLELLIQQQENLAQSTFSGMLCNMCKWCNWTCLTESMTKIKVYALENSPHLKSKVQTMWTAFVSYVSTLLAQLSKKLTEFIGPSVPPQYLTYIIISIMSFATGLSVFLGLLILRMLLRVLYFFTIKPILIICGCTKNNKQNRNRTVSPTEDKTDKGALHDNKEKSRSPKSTTKPKRQKKEE